MLAFIPELPVGDYLPALPIVFLSVCVWTLLKLVAHTFILLTCTVNEGRCTES